MNLVAQSPGPPQAPEIPRKFKFWPLQLIGVPIILLIPLLALAGIFDLHVAHVQVTGKLALSVMYPTRSRYDTFNEMIIAVTNTTQSPLTEVIVQLERAYLDHFAQITATPDISMISEAFYEIALGELAPGTTRVITLDFQAHEQGTHEGRATAVSAETDPIELSLNTLVLP